VEARAFQARVSASERSGLQPLRHGISSRTEFFRNLFSRADQAADKCGFSR
jgi:hypothetical protein